MRIRDVAMKTDWLILAATILGFFGVAWTCIKIWPRTEKWLGGAAVAVIWGGIACGAALAVYAVLTGEGCSGSRHDLIEERDRNYDGG